MAYELEIFRDSGLDAEFVEWLVEEYSAGIANHFSKLWEYYSNRMEDNYGANTAVRKINESSRSYVQAQEYGLPARITGVTHSAAGGIFGGQAVSDIQRKEVVIENDIAWRVNAAVDFLFGKPIGFVSRAPDSQKRAEIESILKAVFAANGGIGFFQDMAVLGSVYGFVDCFVRPDMEITEHVSLTSQNPRFEKVLEAAQTITLELIEAPRALPVLDENDYRKIKYYVQHFYQKKNARAKEIRILAGYCRRADRILTSGRRRI